MEKIGNKHFDFDMTHAKACKAEKLLGCGLLAWTGGGITYTGFVGFALLDGQHGIKTIEDFQALQDQEGGQKIDELVGQAVVNFMSRHYPRMNPILSQVAPEKTEDLPQETEE